MKPQLSIIICGFMGRMGQAISKLAEQDGNMQIVGATIRSSSGKTNKKAGVFLSESLEEVIAKANSDLVKPIIIDFSSANSTILHAQIAMKYKLPLIVGSTGLKDAQISALQKAAEKIPVLFSSNMSLGANVLFALASFTARLLGGADVEISEIHHSGKKDCPSGTALNLAKMVAEARNQDIKKHLVLNRNSQELRKPGEIGVVGLRGGSTKGDHSVYFFSENESIELKHHVDDPRVFAQGALKAAWYLALQKPGLHNMMDVLGIKTL